MKKFVSYDEKTGILKFSEEIIREVNVQAMYEGKKQMLAELTIIGEFENLIAEAKGEKPVAAAPVAEPVAVEAPVEAPAETPVVEETPVVIPAEPVITVANPDVPEIPNI